MGIFKTIKKAVQKTVAKALGLDANSRAQRPDAQMGPAGAEASRRTAAPKRKARGARGRDSTIITAGSTIGTRTLLG